MGLFKSVHNNKLYNTHVANMELPFGVYRGRKFVLLSPDASVFRKFLFYIRKLFRIIKTDPSSIEALHQLSERKVHEYPPVELANKLGGAFNNLVEHAKTTLETLHQQTLAARDRVIDDLRRGHETISQAFEKMKQDNEERVAKLHEEISELKETAKKKFHDELDKIKAAHLAEMQKLHEEHDKIVNDLKNKLREFKTQIEENLSKNKLHEELVKIKAAHSAEKEKLQEEHSKNLDELNRKQQEYKTQFEINLNKKKQEIVEAEKEISSLGRELEEQAETIKKQEETFKSQIEELKIKIKTKKAEHHHNHSKEVSDLKVTIAEQKKTIAHLEGINHKDAVFALIREMDEEDQITCVNKFMSDLQKEFIVHEPVNDEHGLRDSLFDLIRKMDKNEQAKYVKALIIDLKDQFPHHTIGKKAVSFKLHTEEAVPARSPSPVDPISEEEG